MLMTTIILNLREGEVSAILTLLTEQSALRPCPLTAKGSNIAGRPTIDVTIKAAGTRQELKMEYMGGRGTCMKQQSDHETEHFLFEWTAPRSRHSDQADDV